MLSASAWSSRLTEWPSWNWPSSSSSTRFCVQTKYAVEPGRNSQRRHRVAAQRVEVEVRVVEGDCGGRTRAVGIGGVRVVAEADRRVAVEVVAARSCQLAEIGVGARGQQRLRVELQAEARREGPVETDRGRQGLLFEAREHVAVAVGVARQRVLERVDVLRAVARHLVARLQAQVEVGTGPPLERDQSRFGTSPRPGRSPCRGSRGAPRSCADRRCAASRPTRGRGGSWRAGRRA